MRITTITPLLATAALLVSACGSDSENSTARKTSATPTPSAAAAKPLPKDPNTTVTPGRYATSAFKSQLTLEVPKGQRWRVSGAGETADGVALELLAGPEVAINTLAFMHIAKVADPERGARTSADAVTAPAEFIDWLVAHPRLKAQKPEQVTIGGLTGRAVTVSSDSAPKRMPDECIETSRDCVPLFFDGDEPIVYMIGDSVRFTALDLGGEQLIIEQFAAPPDQFDRVLGLMQPLLDSVEIG